MDTGRIKTVIEALLFVSDKPLDIETIEEVLGKDGVSREDLLQIMRGLIDEYNSLARAVAIEEVGGGFQFRTRPEFSPWIKKLAKARPLRLTKPSLEVLSIIAYRQPVTHHEIELIRGVDSGGILEHLLAKKLVVMAGRKQAPGRPILYKTTPLFLEVFNLKDLKDLPTLREYKDLSELGDLEPAARSLLEKIKDSTGGIQPDLPMTGADSQAPQAEPAAPASSVAPGPSPAGPAPAEPPAEPGPAPAQSAPDGSSAGPAQATPPTLPKSDREPPKE